MGKPLTSASAVLLVLVNFASFLGVLLLGSALSGDEELVSVPFRIGAVVLAPLIALYVGLVRHAPDEGTLAALRLGPPERGQWPSLALAIFCGAALGAPIYLLYKLLIALAPLEGEPEKLSSAAKLAIGIGQVAAAAFVEALYRGLIQPRLSLTLGLRRALWVTVLIFIVGQLDALAIPIAAVTGTVCGIIAAATGTTWGAVAASVALQLCVAILPDDKPPLWAAAAGAVAAGLTLYAIWRRRIVAA